MKGLNEASNENSGSLPSKTLTFSLINKIKTSPQLSNTCTLNILN